MQERRLVLGSCSIFGGTSAWNAASLCLCTKCSKQIGLLCQQRHAATFLCLPSQRTPSTTSDEFQFAGGPRSLELEPFELSSSSSSSLSSASQSKLQPQRSKNKGKSLNPFAVSSSSSNPLLKGSEANNQIPKNLLQLAKNKGKEGKEKKKKKGKGGSAPTSGRGWRRRRGRGDFQWCSKW